MLPHHLEEHALNAWPGLTTYLLDGTVVRLAEGYTKRANSATPLYDGYRPWDEKMAAVETIFQQASLPPIFRLLSFRPDSAELDKRLAQAGYQYLDETVVFTLALKNVDPAPANGTITIGADAFVTRYHNLRQAEIHPAHRRILQQAAGTRRCLMIATGGQPAAVGLAIHQGPVVGIFDVFTHPNHRRQGLGRAIVSALLNWGHDRGATTAYLQVMTDNKAAIALYHSLGFREAYQYWYRRLTIDD